MFDKSALLSQSFSYTPDTLTNWSHTRSKRQDDSTAGGARRGHFHNKLCKASSQAGLRALQPAAEAWSCWCWRRSAPVGVQNRYNESLRNLRCITCGRLGHAKSFFFFPLCCLLKPRKLHQTYFSEKVADLNHCFILIGNTCCGTGLQTGPRFLNCFLSFFTGLAKLTIVLLKIMPAIAIVMILWSRVSFP